MVWPISVEGSVSEILGAAMIVILTFAATADRLSSLHSNASVFLEALEVLLRRSRPSFGELGALGLEGVVMAKDVFAFFFALRADASHAERELFLLWNVLDGGDDG